MTDLRVLFIHSQLCTRAWKEAKTLAAAGVHLDLIELSRPASHMDYSPFHAHHHIPVDKDMRSILRGRRTIRRDLTRLIAEIDPDIVHTHNAPDCLGAWVPRSTKLPVVHDVHDIQAVIPTRYSGPLQNLVIDRLQARWERMAARGADAILTFSPRARDYFIDTYGIDKVWSLENKPMEAPVERLPKRSDTEGGTHLVYAGGVSFARGSNRDVMDDLTTIAHHDDLHVHVYAVTYTEAEQERVAALCAAHPRLHHHDVVPQERFIAEMSQYDYGLIWFSGTHPNLRMATSNRCYEMQVAGLPILTNLEGSYIAEYVEGKGCGLVLDDAAALVAALRDPPTFRLDPSDCFIEVQDILDVYDDVLARRT